MFRSSSDVEADASADYGLSEEDGPWMILASTCVGEGSKARAERLALEIRRELGLPAYIYRERFDFTGRVNKPNLTERYLRHANSYQYEAYAVLVGEYDRVENENIERDLHTLKTARLPVFEDKEEVEKETSGTNPVTAVQAMSQKLLAFRKDKTLGAMAGAFVTRNPLLPAEYFDAPTVDSFVSQLNEDKEYSLLSCKGKYTVVVATFAGLGTIVDGKKEKDFVPSMKRMDRYAADADKMVKKLRADGVEAYQYHDRTRSLVTVGSFETLGRELPDRRFEYTPEIRQTVEKYRAFNPRVARQVPGKTGIAVNHAALIPFDINPAPIAVPRVSKRSLYNGVLGMR
ncbi:hypothetical protein [Novipirellula artificiosorum]|nr:hypothetical protein [Novipirellula artificiosorum]